MGLVHYNLALMQDSTAATVYAKLLEKGNQTSKNITETSFIFSIYKLILLK